MKSDTVIDKTFAFALGFYQVLGLGEDGEIREENMLIKTTERGFVHYNNGREAALTLSKNIDMEIVIENYTDICFSLGFGDGISKIKESESETVKTWFNDILAIDMDIYRAGHKKGVAFGDFVDEDIEKATTQFFSDGYEDAMNGRDTMYEKNKDSEDPAIQFYLDGYNEGLKIQDQIKMMLN